MNLQEREHPRYAHDAALTFTTDAGVLPGRVANLSRGGLCATLSQPLVVGQYLAVDIQLVFDDERQSEPLRLPGFVVWCTAVDDGHQVGVSFHGIDSEKAEDLTMFLRYLDDGGSPRSPKVPISIDERFG